LPGKQSNFPELVMTRFFMAGAAVALLLGGATSAEAQFQTLPPMQTLAPAPFQIQPALPETMPTWAQDQLSGTAQHNIAATPDCGAANPQGGIPSMWSGTCP
jgi:hypothetical protein